MSLRAENTSLGVWPFSVKITVKSVLFDWQYSINIALCKTPLKEIILEKDEILGMLKRLKIETHTKQNKKDLEEFRKGIPN